MGSGHERMVMSTGIASSSHGRSDNFKLADLQGFTKLLFHSDALLEMSQQLVPTSQHQRIHSKVLGRLYCCAKRLHTLHRGLYINLLARSLPIPIEDSGLEKLHDFDAKVFALLDTLPQDLGVSVTDGVVQGLQLFQFNFKSLQQLCWDAVGDCICKGLLAFLDASSVGHRFQKLLDPLPHFFRIQDTLQADLRQAGGHDGHLQLHRMAKFHCFLELLLHIFSSVHQLGEQGASLVDHLVLFQAGFASECESSRQVGNDLRAHGFLKRPLRLPQQLDSLPCFGLCWEIHAFRGFESLQEIRDARSFDSLLEPLLGCLSADEPLPAHDDDLLGQPCRLSCLDCSFQGGKALGRVQAVHDEVQLVEEASSFIDALKLCINRSLQSLSELLRKSSFHCIRQVVLDFPQAQQQCSRFVNVLVVLELNTLAGAQDLLQLLDAR
mmetsp:Transcript_60911/g.142611  ORF Transcript_60911/g.142611 Transcript_60911/m.142611 type:complete len:438 (+) Transcript_60911:985-2298(+)